MSFDTMSGDVELDVDGSIDVLSDEGITTHLWVEGAAPLRLRFSRRSDERLVGFGERFVRLGQTGRRFEGRIVDLLAADPRDTYFHLPFCLSSSGYGVLVDTHAQVLWDLGASDPSCWTVEVPAAAVHLWIFRGRPKRVVSEMTAVAGRPTVPPPWALGVWKTTLGGSEAVLRQAQRLRDHDVPVTACWVYDHYHEATNSGCGYSGTHPPGPYPDLGAVVDGLHDLGFRALGYVQPGLFEGSDPSLPVRTRSRVPGPTARRRAGPRAVLQPQDPPRADRIPGAGRVRRPDGSGRGRLVPDPPRGGSRPGLGRVDAGRGRAPARRCGAGRRHRRSAEPEPLPVAVPPSGPRRLQQARRHRRVRTVRGPRHRAVRVGDVARRPARGLVTGPGPEQRPARWPVGRVVRRGGLGSGHQRHRRRTRRRRWRARRGVVDPLVPVRGPEPDHAGPPRVQARVRHARRPVDERPDGRHLPEVRPPAPVAVPVPPRAG